MDDGVSIAATLYVPDGAPPAGGWPAIVFLHGLAGNRQQMNALVEGYGFTGGSYAILTFDARGTWRVRRARRDRRPARDRRHARRARLARGATGRLRHEDRRLGHLLRRRRGLQLARGRSSVGGRRDGRDVDRPLLGAHASGAREVRARRRSLELDSRCAARSVAGRAHGGGVRRRHDVREALGRGALEPVQARHR